MLIWKVIAANPGITRAEIWKRVEHSIPEGYALRRYARSSHCSGVDSLPSESTLRAARGFILTEVLNTMQNSGTVTKEGSRFHRRFTVAREPAYRGSPAAIDETGTKAAEHMAVAEAVRITEKMLGRAKDPDERGPHGPVVYVRRREYDALVLLVKAIRAQGRAE